MTDFIKQGFQSLAVIIILVLGVQPAANAQTQAFTPEDGLNTHNISVQDITKDGRYIAALTSTRENRLGVNHDRFADPNYITPGTDRFIIIDVATGDQRELFEEDVQVRQISWSPDGDRLAFFLLEDNEYELFMYDRQSGDVERVHVNSTKQIASNSLLEWRPDGSGLLFQLRAEGWAQKGDSMYTELTEGPIIVQDSKNDFLAWERVRNHSGKSILAQVDLSSGNVEELTPEGSIDDLNQAESGEFITFTEVYPTKTDYQRSGGAEYALVKLSMNNGAVDTLVSRSDEEPDADWNHAGDRYAFSEDGKVYLRSTVDEDSLEITAGYYEKVEEGDTTEIEYSVMRWHPEDTHLLLSSDDGYHLIDTEGESIELVYEFPENQDQEPQRYIVNWSPDGEYLYMTYSARDKWERGLTRYNIEDREMEELMIDNNLYSGWRFAEDGSRMIFEMSDGDHPSELYVVTFENDAARQLTDLNPWIEDRKLTRSELIEYMDVDGDTLYGVLYYPVDYEEGKKYPLIAYVYESFFNNGFNPSANIYANKGYFLFRPSVNFDTGYPAEAWIKGVTTGINKLIERGMVDPTKLGVEGISYGGYATNLLITQTDRFAAAINISGKVNMVSFLGDSPKITTRNYDAAEVGQDRIGETLWEATDKYIAHSAIFFADRIETPLLMLTGEGDWNVPATNQREMYYALRRLGKEVKWVHYMDAGHGAGLAGRVEDYHHHWDTVFEWYDSKFYPEEKE